VFLQDILQAALHVETDLEQCPVTTSLVTASASVYNNTHPKLKTAEQHFDGHDSAAASKVFDVRAQYSDNSTKDTAKVAVDPVAIFSLSQDDFNDDIDDLSFIDLPQHSELPQVVKSSSVTSDCEQAAAAATASKNNSLLLPVTGVISENHCLQLPNNYVVEMHDVNNAVSAQNQNQSFDIIADSPYENG